MSVTEIKKPTNSNAIEMLELAIEKVKSGDISAISLSWVTGDGAIGGDVSQGDNNLLMWSAINYSEKSFYYNVIIGE